MLIALPALIVVFIVAVLCCEQRLVSRADGLSRLGEPLSGLKNVFFKKPNPVGFWVLGFCGFLLFQCAVLDAIHIK